MRAWWHPDPENPDRMRWWDGQRWTSATKAAGGTQPPPRLTPVPGATASKTPGEKAKDRRRLLLGGRHRRGDPGCLPGIQEHRQ